MPAKSGEWEEAIWEAATVLEPSEGGSFRIGNPQKPSEYKGKVFAASGPNLAGLAASPGGSRIAVDSWSGKVRPGPDLMEYSGSFRQFLIDSLRAGYKGTYWIDIYDTASAKRLIQIRGEFRRDDPNYFQGRAKWLNGSLYILPLEPDGMRRLLVCDVDAAARLSGVQALDTPVPLERAKPYPNHSRSYYQVRFLDAETPQARITGFQSNSVYRMGSREIEAVNITALIDVQVPGTYSLRLDAGGVQKTVRADLRAGSAKIDVPLRAADLVGTGLGGPFYVTFAQLTREVADGMILADNRTDPGFFKNMPPGGKLESQQYPGMIDAIIKAYSPATLGALLYFTGENSAKLTRGTGSQPDRLEVRIGLHAEDTDCRGYGSVTGAEDPNGLVYGAPDRRTLVLIFTGKGLFDSGDYQVQQVGVRCDSHSIRTRRIDIPRE